MRNRKAFFAIQGSIILGFIILNVLIFYMVNCNGEYLQSRDVWGNTQTILKSDLKSRQKLINEFSQNTATAVENIDGILAQIEKNEQLEKEKARKNRYKKEKTGCYGYNQFHYIILAGGFYAAFVLRLQALLLIIFRSVKIRLFTMC